MSPFNHFKIHDNYNPELSGFVLLDMYILYKELTQNKRESYKLDYIANFELGKRKVEHEETLDELYRDDLMRFIKYNIQDVKLLDELANQLDHIGLQNELRITTSSVWKYGTPSRFVDGIVNTTLSKKNKVATTFYKRYKRRNITGAFVSAPLPGIHNWLIDLDAASLYPSIILSNNIGPNTYKAKICPRDAFYYCYDKDKLSDTIKIWKDPVYNADFPNCRC
jgi:DNA polymerase I